jgi:uncharacterized protein (DUF1778 family)
LTSENSEKKEVFITFSTTPEKKELIQQACDISGTSLASFSRETTIIGAIQRLKFAVEKKSNPLYLQETNYDNRITHMEEIH